MTNIERFYDKSIIIMRLKATGAEARERHTSTGTVEAHLQRLDQASAFESFGVTGVTHKAWCDINTDVKVNDRIKDPSGNLFYVKEVIKNGEDWAMNEHLLILMTQYDGKTD